MPIIRRKYHWGAYYLNPAVVGDGPQLGGQTVDVKTKSNYERVAFAGFKTYERAEDVTAPIIVINVLAYSHGDEPLWQDWIEYCRNTALLGSYGPEGVSLALIGDEGLPLAWCPMNRVRVQ